MPTRVGGTVLKLLELTGNSPPIHIGYLRFRHSHGGPASVQPTSRDVGNNLY